MKNFTLKKMKTILLLLGLFISASATLQAQNVTVKGTVTNEKAEPIPNISILVKGTSNGSTTDEKGNYLLTVKDSSAVLIFSSIGYELQETKVGNQSTINVTLKSGEAGKLTDVVVVGYGTQKKVTVTGAVAQVKGAELQKSPAVNMSNSLAGRLPGVVATNASG